ncbi:hypothetical protein GQ600_20118 [Phytophthora cactorum]|nr:hypothetical protein GQ600_20118 [Phytophthora cactorum]
MGKELGCSVSETIQLCLSWLETSENAVRGAGQKKSSFQRSLQPYEFPAAWKELKDKPQWTEKITSATNVGAKRGASDSNSVSRPIMRKAVKAANATAKEQQIGQCAQTIGDEAYLRFVAATKKKADLMDQNLYLAIFMQNPTRDESQELFHAAQSHSGQNEKKKNTWRFSKS